jgi:hypothetical protein
MTRKIAGTCFAAVFAFALTASAQTPPASPQTPTTPQAAPTSPYPSSQSADKMDKMDHAKASKLTGCVQSGTTAGTFELSNVKKGAKADATTASSDTSATANTSGRTVKLVAAAGVDLTAHVGHQVEVSGNWDKAATADAAPATPPTSADATSTSASKGGAFNVTDVKMVSATCSAGTN